MCLSEKLPALLACFLVWDEENVYIESGLSQFIWYSLGQLFGQFIFLLVGSQIKFPK